MTATVDVPINIAAEEINICSATDSCRFTKATTIGITRHDATCQDVDVGVVLLFFVIEVARIAGLDVCSQFGERKMLCC